MTCPRPLEPVRVGAVTWDLRPKGLHLNNVTLWYAEPSLCEELRA